MEECDFRTRLYKQHHAVLFAKSTRASCTSCVSLHTAQRQDHQVRPCHSSAAIEASCHVLQRTNGRIAMIAFAGAAAAELSTGKSIVEQASASPLFITFMVVLLTVAGFMPKLASGVSLSRLIDAAGMLCSEAAAMSQ